MTTSLRGIVNAIGLTVAILTAVSIPTGYFTIGYSNMASVLAYRADQDSRLLARYIYSHSALWQYQRVRLAELLEQTDEMGRQLRKRVVDAAGTVVLDEGFPVASPVITRTSAINVGGATVGHVELATSFWPLAEGTGIAAFFSFLLGFVMFYALRVLPLRVLDRTLGVLQSTNRRFDAALSNMSQGLAMFDAQDRMVVCNPRFISMFCLTPDLVRPGTTFREAAARIASHSNLFRETADEIVADRERVIAGGKPCAFVRELNDGRVIFITGLPSPAAAGCPPMKT